MCLRISALFAGILLLSASAESGPTGLVADDAGVPSLSSHASMITFHPIDHGSWHSTREYGSASAFGQCWLCVISWL